MKALYDKHWRSIQTHKRNGKNVSNYTIFWDPSTDTPHWDEELLNLFHEQNKRFKINFSHSFLLKHKESKELSFVQASSNNHSVLDSPRLIQSKTDFLVFLHEINDKDIYRHVQNERPSSRYSVEKIMSSSFYVFHLPEYPIGCSCDELPSFLKENKHLYTLQKDKHHGFLYSDGLCLFRCLAIQQGASLRSIQTPTLTLF